MALARLFKSKKRLKKEKAINKNELEDVLSKNALRIQDMFCPDALAVELSCLRFGGGKQARVYVIHGLPRRLKIGWLDEVFRAGDIDISIHFMPASDRHVVKSLVTKETKARTQRTLDKQSGNISRLPELEAAIVDYRALRDTVQLGSDRLIYITILIAVHAAGEEELRRRCDIVENVLARKGILPRVLECRQAEGLKSALPLASLKINDFQKNLTSGCAACCLPVTASTTGHPSGAALGQNIFSQSLVFIDRFAGEHIISNQHLFVSGVTGAGKSVTVRLLALLEADLGVMTAFVDAEGEYAYFTREMGGQVVSLAPGRFSGMNILEVEPEFVDEDEKIERVNIQEKMADVHDLIAAVARYHSGQGLDMRLAALLEEALMEEYRSRGITTDPESLYSGGIKKAMPTLADLQARLAGKPGAEVLSDAIKPLLREGSLGMFDGQTTLRLAQAPFICFNLKGVTSEFARFVAVYAVLSWLWQKFAQRGGRAVKKCVTVDEAWMFLRYPDAAKYLETLARRGRKHGCALTVATQRFEEFANSEAGKAVIDSCATIMVLKQEEHAADAAVEYFKLAGGCRDLLAKATPGRGILRLSGSTMAVQITPAPFEWRLVETKI